MGTKVVKTFESPRVKPDQIDVTTAATGAALVATNTTQTLTNKTLTSPTITSPTVTTPAQTVSVGTFAATGDAIGNSNSITTTCPAIVTISGADGTKGVQLPSGGASGGKHIFLKNLEAANAVLKVYPPTSGTLNDESANTALSLAANTAYHFFSTSNTAWYTQPNL